MAILKSFGERQFDYEMGKRGGNSLEEKTQIFTASEINRLNSKAKRKYPQSNLGNKSIAKEQRMGEGEPDVQPQVARGPGLAESGMVGLTGSGGPACEAAQRGPVTDPGFAGSRSGWTIMPKDSTANIFFINIFYFLFLD